MTGKKGKRKSYKDEANYWRRRYEELEQNKNAGVVSPQSSKENLPPNNDTEEKDSEAEKDNVEEDKTDENKTGDSDNNGKEDDKLHEDDTIEVTE